MELVERYLLAIRFWLPKQQKEDIAAELSEEIRAQVEERRAALGRELTEGEVEALLRRFGAPLVVANRYLPQESLIGPMLFPIYRLVVKIVALCFLVPWMVVGVVLAVCRFTWGFGTGNASVWETAVQLFGSTLSSGLVSMGLITLVFATLERTLPKGLVEEWNPRRLPALRNPNVIPRFSSGLELGVTLFAAVWWAGNMASPIVWNRLQLRIELSSCVGLLLLGIAGADGLWCGTFGGQSAPALLECAQGDAAAAPGCDGGGAVLLVSDREDRDGNWDCEVFRPSARQE